MYNEEASKYGATMATGFALLSMDKNIGTFYIIGTKNGNGGYQSYQNLKSMEEKGLIIRKKNQMMVVVC
jgi:hypothetical protein